MTNNNKEILTSIYNIAIIILDKYYTPWYKISIKEDNRVVVETLNTISSIMVLQEADINYYSVESSLWNRNTRQHRRIALIGYFNSEEEVSAQLLKNIMSIETEIENNIIKD